MGIEIRTFASLKEITEFTVDKTGQYKLLFEDYSQWLGSLLRTCEETHKGEDWLQKSAALQKNLRGQTKKAPEPKEGGKKSGKKGKNMQVSCWIQSGPILISSTDQGQCEVLFEAIEKINNKIQEFDKFKVTVQQLERIGLGKTVSYLVYVEDDVPKKIVLRAKSASGGDEAFKFETDLSAPGLYGDFSMR